jgi:hypothetical protein
MCHNVFGSFLGRVSWGLMTRRDFFGVIVGGGGGVSGNGDIGAGPPRHARHINTHESRVLLCPSIPSTENILVTSIVVATTSARCVWTT